MCATSSKRWANYPEHWNVEHNWKIRHLQEILGCWRTNEEHCKTVYLHSMTKNIVGNLGRIFLFLFVKIEGQAGRKAVTEVGRGGNKCGGVGSWMCHKNRCQIVHITCTRHADDERTKGSGFLADFTHILIMGWKSRTQNPGLPMYDNYWQWMIYIKLKQEILSFQNDTKVKSLYDGLYGNEEMKMSIYSCRMIWCIVSCICMCIIKEWIWKTTRKF